MKFEILIVNLHIEGGDASPLIPKLYVQKMGPDGSVKMLPIPTDMEHAGAAFQEEMQKALRHRWEPFSASLASNPQTMCFKRTLVEEVH